MVPDADLPGREDSPPSPLGPEAAAAAESGLAALSREADLRQLQAAAHELGSVLLRAASDDDLWERLRPAPVMRETLTAEQEHQLRLALQVDWLDLLRRLGYSGRPPAEVRAHDLKVAVAEALERREPADMDRARMRLHELGEQLLGEAERPQPRRSRLRRLLRRGVHAAGAVAIVVGAAAGAVGLIHLLPFHPGIAAFVAEVAVEVVKDGLVRMLDGVLERSRPEEAADERGEVEPLDRFAQLALAGVERGRLGALVATWGMLSDTQSDGGAVPPTMCEDAVAQTHELLARRAIALHRVWDASVGASWSDPHVELLCRQLSDALGLVERQLRGEGGRLDPGTMARLLDAVARVVDELEARLAQAMPVHGGPD